MLEGISGSGKSTLIQALASKLQNTTIIPEPLPAWTNVDNQGNLFAQFLDNPQRWGFTYQAYVFTTRYQALQKAFIEHPASSLYLSDGSAFSCIYPYSQLYKAHGFTTGMESYIYRTMTDFLSTQLPYKPSGFVYLRVSAQTAWERARKRNRPLRESLELSYFEELYGYYESWLVEKNDLIKVLKDVPVLVLDGEADFVHDTKIQEAMAAQITGFAQSLANR